MHTIRTYLLKRCKIELCHVMAYQRLLYETYITVNTPVSFLRIMNTIQLFVQQMYFELILNMDTMVKKLGTGIHPFQARRIHQCYRVLFAGWYPTSSLVIAGNIIIPPRLLYTEGWRDTILYS